MTAFGAFLITALSTYKSGAMEKQFYCTFNHFQLVGFTFKVKFRIIHQKIVLAFNFGVAIYIVGKLIFR